MKTESSKSDVKPREKSKIIAVEQEKAKISEESKINENEENSKIDPEERVAKLEKKLATSISSISSQLGEKSSLNEPESLEEGEIVSRDGHENSEGSNANQISSKTAEKEDPSKEIKTPAVKIPEINPNRGSAKRKSS